VEKFWSLAPDLVLEKLSGASDGLASQEAEARLAGYGPNALDKKDKAHAVKLFLRQFSSPLVLILVFAAVVAIAMNDWLDGGVIIFILIISAALGFVQEYRAANLIEALQTRLARYAQVMRDGVQQKIMVQLLVPGDIVLLSAGSLVPADGLILEAKDFFVSEAILTGESLPVEKLPGPCPESAPISQRTNAVFMGTSVRSGTARMLVVHTGKHSLYGDISTRLSQRAPETEFERGLRDFGYLLMQVMFAMTVVVFSANIILARPALESILFAIALAVGLSPELLPAIISIMLASGARRMAAKGLLVRHLSAIENLGGVSVFCTDKTGTLTTGEMQLSAAIGFEGSVSDRTRSLAILNAKFQTGMVNPLDEALLAAEPGQTNVLDQAVKLDEIPYDFSRKRLGIVVGQAQQRLLIVKGALASVLDVCDQVRLTQGGTAPLDTARADIETRFANWGREGYRVLGVASRPVDARPRYDIADETGLIFEGFLLFQDPPKPGIETTLDRLRQLGISIKIITGDNRHVSRHLAEAVGIASPVIVTGAELDEMNEAALWKRAPEIDLFVEVDPQQKERIVLALRKSRLGVAYMGDGINDAPALHAADAAISVEGAVDIAKEAADFVMLEHDLNVILAGIELSRTTFANSMKYVLATISANFGNMLSMAIATLFLPFLPMLASQILLNNLLADFPAMTLTSDSVDRDQVERPHRWDIKSIRKFMVSFGLLSTVFDLLTFAVLLWMTGSDAAPFRTGWFLESLATQLLVFLILRTRGFALKSRPGTLLLISTLAVIGFAFALPYLPLADLFGFVPLNASVIGFIAAITLAYIASTEVMKLWFFRSLARQQAT